MKIRGVRRVVRELARLQTVVTQSVVESFPVTVLPAPARFDLQWKSGFTPGISIDRDANSNMLKRDADMAMLVQ